MQKIYIFCAIICLSITSLSFADKNTEFSNRINWLQEMIPDLQTESYQSSYNIFLDRKKILMEDDTLYKNIKEALPEDKFIISSMKKPCIIKKRRNDNIKESYIWELSHLLGVSDLFVPSFPLDIGSKSVVVQEKILFICAEEISRIPPRILLNKVPLIDYWRAHIAMYLFGCYDLVGRNIGVTPQGKICLFDMEASFRYRNQVTWSVDMVFVGFISQAFDWPHYRRVLSKKEAEELRAFKQRLNLFLEKWVIYRAVFPIDIEETAFLERLEKILSFSFDEGVSFYDFYCFIEPKVGPALDTLLPLAEKIMKRPVDHGSALMLISRDRKLYQMSSKQKRKLMKWMDIHIKE